MKKSLVFSLFFGSLVQLLTPACTKNKELEIVDEPNPGDTIATIVVNPVDTVVNRYVYVTDVNTQMPLADCEVTLLYYYFHTFGYGDEYAVHQILGRTDSNGRFVWKWDGKPLPGNAYLSAASRIDYDNLALVQHIAGTPPETIYLKKRNITSYRIHIDYRLDTLPESRLELNTPYVYQLNTAYVAPHDEIVFGKDTPQPFDTTILVRGYSLKTYDYKIRYLLDHVYYPNIPAPGITRPFSITFPTVDTGYIEIIIE